MPARSRQGGLSPTLAELIVGIVEVGVMAGLGQIVAVFDARIYRIVKAAGCDPQLIGRPQRIGDTMSYVGVFDTATVRSWRSVGLSEFRARCWLLKLRNSSQPRRPRQNSRLLRLGL